MLLPGSQIDQSEKEEKNNNNNDNDKDHNPILCSSESRAIIKSCTKSVMAVGGKNPNGILKCLTDLGPIVIMANKDGKYLLEKHFTPIAKQFPDYISIDE
jgi:hypothetical protein